MIKTTLIFVIIFSTCALAQKTDSNNAAADFKKVQIGINVSPDICYRTLQNNSGSSTSALIINMRNDNELPKFGYTAGINVCYNISTHIGIETGVQYSNKGYQTKMNDLVFGDPIDPKYGFSYSSSGSGASKAKFIYNDYYFDIPLRINFKTGKKKLCFSCSAGFAVNIFSHATNTIVLEDNNGNTRQETSSQNYNYNKVNLSAIVSAGAAYKINDRMELRAEPTFRYGLLKIIDAPITGYLWNGGLNIGYYYALK